MGWIIERGMVPVNCEIAIFDLKGALAPQDKPLMLQPVLFCPVLTWAAQELMDCGVQRYFIVCPENCRRTSVRCTIWLPPACSNPSPPVA